MNNFYIGLKFAISYFTIFPVRFKESDDLSKKEILNSMVFSLPFNGLILGLATILVYSFLDSIPLLGAIIASCIYMVLYGFIHTEAIADVADAIYARHSGKDAYEVIKEPTIGAMGLLYTSIFVILKVSALSYLFYNNLILEFLAILIISRVCIQFIIYFFDFKSSFLNSLKEAFSFKSFLVSFIITSIFIASLIEVKFLLVFLSSFLLAFFITKFIKKAVGFLNGDALGTTLELVELILSLMVCYLWL